eukprot:CAMPEP_0171627556 /NCGR_PEP_ID=MMETSP0990-20121206/20843_1 /TAXON_ID=483369 /ORGANISM="non described non described, Strain CCMP2098" /LENGTH=118 /DNA_ID=CAMNT_0012195435 /DNA_START=374 /DNA_END=731 /DNA_ORIENTATION=-
MSGGADGLEAVTNIPHLLEAKALVVSHQNFVLPWVVEDGEELCSRGSALPSETRRTPTQNQPKPVRPRLRRTLLLGHALVPLSFGPVAVEAAYLHRVEVQEPTRLNEAVGVPNQILVL